ncbi:MAG: hypothetical protein GAK41_00467 [Burkholderia gladioli]|nr:MAG: hypothetical protein GAK41_00467 [Burkholderia gladioli]
MAIEHRVRQVGARAFQVGRQHRRARQRGVEFLDRRRDGARHRGEHGQQVGQIVARGGFVDRHADARFARAAQVDALGARRVVQRRGLRAGFHRQRVEEGAVDGREAELLEARGQQAGDAVHAQRDRLQAARAVIDGIRAGHDGEQRLRRADVRGGLFAADMLLARLQREAHRRLALRVDGHADEPARHLPLEFVAHREVRGVRAAEADRHAEALGVADRDVRAPFARRRQHRQREQVGRHQHVAADRVHGFGQRAIVAHVAVDARVLQQHAERVGLGGLRDRAGDHFDADRHGARADHFERLRQHVVGHEEAVRLRLAVALQQRHRLGGGGGLVEQRGVRDGQPGEVDHHLLEVQKRFQAALRDFWLVRRVGRVPGGIFEHVTQDHGRRMRVVIALADEGPEHLVLIRQLAQRGERFRLAFRLREWPERQRFLAADRGGNHRIHQRRARREAKRVEHGLLAGGVGADVAFGERIARFERGEREGRAVHQMIRVVELHGIPAGGRGS